MAQNGDEEVYKLEEVVVTATRDMKVFDTPASISVITATAERPPLIWVSVTS
ncbi:MAG: hypothetical protein JRC91_01195 [Deltaproteobacteria bacterium]|nr:hypothetical protein [Deltaproteobacteria bacterium]